MLNYTHIYHNIRKGFDLNCNEYILADMIFHLSVNPEGRIKGWCYASKKSLAEDLGVSERHIYGIIEKLVDAGLVIKDAETSFLRTTKLWNDIYYKTKNSQEIVKKDFEIAETTHEKSSYTMNKVHEEPTSDTMKKVHTGYEKSSYYNNIDSNIENKEILENSSDTPKDPKKEEESVGGGAASEKIKDTISEYTDCIEIYDQWTYEKFGTRAALDGTQGKAMKSIINYLNKNKKNKDQPVQQILKYIFDNWDLLDNFTRSRIKLNEINSDIMKIIMQIKEGKDKLKTKAVQEQTKKPIKFLNKLT